jgi:hypothetical protein
MAFPLLIFITRSLPGLYHSPDCDAVCIQSSLVFEKNDIIRIIFTLCPMSNFNSLKSDLM